MTPKKILTIFLSIIAILLCANILGLVSRFVFDHDYVFGIIGLFDFNTEKNIPTFYSSIALIIASLLLLFITSIQKNENLPFILWGILSFIFLFLSIDEISSIHEKLNTPIKNTVDATGLFYFAWVIPYGLALIAFAVSYLKFLLVLPKRIMWLFILSGSTFVLGAIGFEMLGGWQAEQNGNRGLLYAIFYTFEELLEMLGVALFIYTLLEYILIKKKSLNISLTSATKEV
ncbi:hypothetical protein [Colwellia sp. 1_MG-2023]|uniref:hypothetical protein n=1 Tax=Colwellia sp. 1_MG-2023 TaxID=3062649 RepID=UPI0026E16F14|nr:hypothetical protein [Colwellia sp. 1_MG-2023]